MRASVEKGETGRSGRWSVRRTGSRAAVHAGLLVLAGCAGSILGTDPQTGLDVSVRKGPIVPVEQEGVDNSAPVEGARVRVRPLGAGGRADGHTDQAGMVVFTLPAGTYVVTVLECPGTLGLPAPDTAAVTDGRHAAIGLACDTGIR